MRTLICSSIALRALFALSTGLSLAAPLAAADAVVEVVVGPKQPVPAKNEKEMLDTPFAMEFTKDGEMIIVEYDGGRVWSWTKADGLNHLAGAGKPGYRDGDAKQAMFNQLHNLVILEDETVLMSDHLTHSVRRYDPKTQQVSTVAGNGSPGPSASSVLASQATFVQPICISLTPDRQALLIADIGNRQIRRWDFATNLITPIAGSGMRGVPKDGVKAQDAPLVDPRGAIQNANGEVYIIERNGHVIRQIDPSGTLTTVAGTGKPGAEDGPALQASMNGPKHLCFGPDGVIFIADDNNHLIRKFDPAAKTLTTVATGEYKLNRPHGVTVHEGWLYIADSYHHRIVRVKL